MSLTTLPAAEVLDRYFLEARSKLLDLAAILDRIDRGLNAAAVGADQRLAAIRRAVARLNEPGPDRTATIQELFSLPYDPTWRRPTPR